MIVTHAQKINFNDGQSVRKIEWKRTDGQTDRRTDGTWSIITKCAVVLLQPADGRYNVVEERIFGEKFYTSDVNRRQHDSCDADENDEEVVVAGKNDVTGPRCDSSAAFRWAQQSPHQTSTIADVYHV